MCLRAPSWAATFVVVSRASTPRTPAARDERRTYANVHERTRTAEQVAGATVPIGAESHRTASAACLKRGAKPRKPNTPARRAGNFILDILSPFCIILAEMDAVARLVVTRLMFCAGAAASVRASTSRRGDRSPRAIMAQPIAGPMTIHVGSGRGGDERARSCKYAPCKTNPPRASELRSGRRCGQRGYGPACVRRAPRRADARPHRVGAVMKTCASRRPRHPALTAGQPRV